MAGDSAQHDRKPTDEKPADLLLLSSILKEAPPVALIKDDEPFDDGVGSGLVDRFGTSEIADRLAKIVERMDPPYTISLSGAWGVGKTWVAKRLKSLLRKSKVPVVEVDLWTEDIDLLRRTLAVEVAVRLTGETNEDKLRKKSEAKARALDRDLRRPEVEPTTPKFTAPGLRSPWAIVTALVAVGLWALLWLALSQPTPPPGSSAQPWVAPVIAGVIAALIWLVLHSGLVLSVSQSSSTLPPIREAVALRNEFRALVTSHQDRKVLVVLDNLDRLTGDDAVKALGEVRSFVELPKSRCMFLVPLDRGALERHLVRTMGGDDQAARDYLDKFFNLDLVLTNPAPADLRESIRGMLTELFPDVQPPALSSVAEFIAAAAGGSPRAAKRIANGIYARAYLLPPDARERVTLLDVAFVEALVARFPRIVPQLSSELDRSLRRIGEVRRVTEPDERLSHLLQLLGQPFAPPAVENEAIAWREQRWRYVQPLADFLLFTRATLPTTDIVRTVLTIRPNRQLARLPDPSAAEAALLAADPTALRDSLGSLAGEDLHSALTALHDMVRTDLAQGWRVGARAGLNALAPVAGVDRSVAGTLRSDAAEYLLTGDADDFRSLSADTIRFLFPRGTRGFPYRAAIADRAATYLDPTPASRMPVAPAVRFVAATADALGPKKLEETKTTLAKFGDEDLSPLFEEGANPTLLSGPVTEMYVGRLANLDPAGELGPHEVAADRLLFAQSKASWDGSTLLDPVYDKINAVLPAVTLQDSIMPLLEKLAELTKPLPPHAQLDTFAQRLTEFTAGGIRAVELALKTPTSPGFIEPIITSLMAGMSAEDFINLGTSRRAELEHSGVNVGDMAAARWAAGQGREYIEVALPGDDSAGLDRVFAGLKGAVDPGTYPNLVGGLADRIMRLRSTDGAERLIADITSRVTTFGPTVVAQLAPEVVKVQGRADPEPLITAMGNMLGSMRREEMAVATEAAKSFVEAGVTGSETLPPVVAAHGAAEGIVDLNNLNWMLDQPAVDGEDVILGLRGAIKSEPQAKVRTALEGMKKTRRRRADIGKALVERAAVEPVGARLPWLEDALESGIPSRKHNATEHDEYEAALNQAVEGDPSTDSMVRQLRQRL